MADGGEADAGSLQFTPTWIMAAVGSMLVLVSIAAERGLHQLGKTLRKKNQKSLYEALLKVKEELMLLGFIPLLLAGFQGKILSICIPPGWTDHMLPCPRVNQKNGKVGATNEHFAAAHILGGIGRRLLSEGGAAAEHCRSKGKVPLLSLEAIQQLDNFIFVLAITHVIFSVSVMLLGGAKIHQWKQWEDVIQKEAPANGPNLITSVYRHKFIKKRFRGHGKDYAILSWLYSFGKQFYGSVSKSDYIAMRLGFIMTHCPGNTKFNFYRYMMRVLEADFKKVVGISWYLWVFMVIFLLLNVNGWHIYFWIAFLPLLLLLAIGTKLEHVIAQLAQDVAERHSAIVGDLVVKPSDEHFWFGRPRIVLHLIHFILFQNAFEIAFFFWVLTTYGFDSCIMGKVSFIVPRLVIGVVIQILCSYSTLPLYVIVTQMGSCFKQQIFDENVQQGLLQWAKNVKKRKRLRRAVSAGATVEESMSDDSLEGQGPHMIQLVMHRQTEEADDAIGDTEIEQQSHVS